MKKIFTTLLIIIFPVVGFAQSSGFYNFRVKTLEGNEFDFSTLKGKKVMIVNTASKCGNTPQYKNLEALYEKYTGELVIIGFHPMILVSRNPAQHQKYGNSALKIMV